MEGGTLYEELWEAETLAVIEWPATCLRPASWFTSESSLHAAHFAFTARRLPSARETIV